MDAMCHGGIVILILGAAALVLAGPLPDGDENVEKISVRGWFGGVSHGHRKPGKPGKYYPGYGGDYDGYKPYGGGWSGGGAASSASASASAGSFGGGGGPGHGGHGGGLAHSNSHAHSQSNSATLGAGPFFGGISSSHAGASASSGAGGGTYHRKPKPAEYYDY